MSISLNDNLQINAPKVLDNKYMKFAAGTTQPWASSSEAVTNILSAYRYQYLTCLCLMNTDPVEYWWRTGTADGNLETKGKESYNFSASSSVALAVGYNYSQIAVIPTVNISNLIIGTTNGANDIEPGTPVNSGTTYTLSFPQYVGSATTLYFGNLTTNTKVLLFKTFL